MFDILNDAAAQLAMSQTTFCLSQNNQILKTVEELTDIVQSQEVIFGEAKSCLVGERLSGSVQQTIGPASAYVVNCGQFQEFYDSGTVDRVRSDLLCESDCSGTGATRFFCEMLIKSHTTLQLAIRRLPPPKGKTYTSKYESQKLLKRFNLASDLFFFCPSILTCTGYLTEYFYYEFTFEKMVQLRQFRFQVHQIALKQEMVLQAYIKKLRADRADIQTQLQRVIEEDFVPQGFDFANVIF